MDLNVALTDDIVARRVVMRRSTWEALTKVADALREMRDVEVSPSEIANIALEAGLDEIRRGLNGTPRPTPQPAPMTPTSGARSRRRVGRVSLDEAARTELRELLEGVGSARARQRTLALWLGLRRRKIQLEALRTLAIEFNAYNVANFAQNMKKDALFFREQRSPEGKRIGWKLTRAGAREAKALIDDVLVAVA